MKALVAVASIALLSICANAQVVFDLPTAMPTNGSEVLLHWNGNTTTMPTSGTGIIWDLTAVVTSEPEARHVLIATPDSTNSGQNFPGATHARGYLLGADTIWDHYALVGDTLWHLGGDYGDLLLCSTPRLTMVFPYALGDLAMNTATCSYAGPPVNTTYGFEPVATGTILYPGGTIPDVVLMRKHQDGIATGYYYWYRTNNVLTSVGEYHDFGVDLWVPASGVGIFDPDAHRALRTYPVPATTDITVMVGGSSAELSYSVLDAAGRIVASGSDRPADDRIRIDVSGLANGEYQLRLRQDDAIRYARVCVAR